MAPYRQVSPPFKWSDSDYSQPRGGSARPRVCSISKSTPLTVGSVLGTLERGRIAERLGDRATAAENYDFVVAVWRNADPELRPYVEEARATLARLGAEPRR